MWGRWGTPQNFLLAFIDEAWKTWKIRLLKNEKNSWRCHHFKLVQQKNTIIWRMQQKRHSQDMECGRHNFCHFRSFFALLPHFWPWKLKLGKNVKKHLEIVSFCTCVPLIKILSYMVPELWSATDRIFLSSWAIFWPFTPPNSPKNENIKNEKNSWRHHHCTQVYQKPWSSIILFQRYGPWRM